MLTSKVLVLSQSCEPIDKIDWQRAITLLYEGKVEVISSYDDRVVRSVTLEFKVPSIVRLLRKLPPRKRGIKFSRDSLYARDRGRCQYCDRALSRPEVTYDHVVPRVAGGKTTWRNVVCCCKICNQKKGGRTPAQAGMRLLSRPVRPLKLPDHMLLTFSWHKGMPESWRAWLRDAAATSDYWHGELDMD
jgi:5-methylcytosine-specific restriction endonuclease McrA